MLAAGGGRPCRRHTGSVAANRRLCWAVSSRFIRVNPSPRPSIPHARQASSRYDLISHPPRTVGTRAGRGTERTEARAGVHQFSSEPVATSGHLAPAGAQPAGPLDMRAATGSVAPQTAPGRPPRAGQCSGDAAAVNTPVVPVASHAVAQDPAAGHAGAPLPQPELCGNATAGGPRQPPSNTGSSRTAKVWPVMGNASPFRAPLCASVPAAPPSDEGPAPQLLPPMDLPAHAPVPDAAPSEAVRAASRAPESSRDDPFAELSPGPLSAAPLLHPQR